MSTLEKTSPRRSTLPLKPTAVPAEQPTKSLRYSLGAIAGVLAIAIYLVIWYWSLEPATFDVTELAVKRAGVEDAKQLPAGYIYASTLSEIAETLLNKRGGYISNDITLGQLMDNMPNWEFGALVMLRDGATALRNNFARAQSQSKENLDLSKAEPYFYFDNNSWVLPATETEYQKGIDHLGRYMKDLLDHESGKAQFYARADNLIQYLDVVIKRLGSLSHRLSASSIQKHQYDLEGNLLTAKTPWLEVDDIFFEARGATWALLHLFTAIEIDFQRSLNNKAAVATVRRIIHEFEDSQAGLLSPVILNGDGFGIFANYSLTMANYITRANAAALDLRDLLIRG
jgi:hypothetical protein